MGAGELARLPIYAVIIGATVATSFGDCIDRRGFLRMGSAAGLSLAQLLRLQASHALDNPGSGSLDLWKSHDAAISVRNSQP